MTNRIENIYVQSSTLSTYNQKNNKTIYLIINSSFISPNYELMIF